MTAIVEHEEHLPHRIIISDLDYAGLAQCCCGQVALLDNWRPGGWRRSAAGHSFSLRWELGENWRQATAEETELLETMPNEMAHHFEPEF